MFLCVLLAYLGICELCIARSETRGRSIKIRMRIGKEVNFVYDIDDDDDD
jgi:hypothetical protein